MVPKDIIKPKLNFPIFKRSEPVFAFFKKKKESFKNIKC